eukprot:CAMPEP_0118855100 /NCGR_PEP_ID=MMETSP1163-20130328/3057_1 /TAXON_ID=124430 /ORGANISM="Phaeomonas parva, Strain CCMP2877" /LENGTH=289 /DNA_ID=CAMNT_0006787931 /DNA_START=141 /DNA_END=1010 /DNA_ORIENTATION=-
MASRLLAALALPVLVVLLLQLPGTGGFSAVANVAERRILELGAITDRGRTASAAQRRELARLVDELCSTPPSVTPPEGAGDGGPGAPAATTPPKEVLRGRWRLVYASVAPYRSSPFFPAFKAATAGVSSPLKLSEAPWAEQVFSVTDALPGYSVGVCQQTITESGLLSQVEIRINTGGYSPLPGMSSLMTTEAAILEEEGEEVAAKEAVAPLRLRVDTTSVKRSTIGRILSFLDLDNYAFPSGATLGRLRTGADVVELRTPYASADLRIAQYDADPDSLFVWVREAEDR